MNDTDFVGGPYHGPPLRGRRKVFCLIRGDVRVAGLSDAPIRWPYVAGPGGKRSLVFCGDLVAAVHVESVLSVSHHWGVSRATVTRWRRALSVGRWTAGTAELWRRQWPRRLGYDGARKGALASAERARERRARDNDRTIIHDTN